MKEKQFLALVVELIVLTAIGYFAFRSFALETQGILSSYSIYIVAVIAGIATFFSPCTFGLLPAYLTFYMKAKNKTKINRSGVYYGIFAALGIVTFNVFLGLVLAFVGTRFAKEFSVAGAGSLSSLTLLIRTIIGSLLLSLGIAHYFHLPIFPNFLLNMGRKTISRKKSPASSLYFYGLGYNLANIGCTGPILAGLIVFSLASGFSVALTAFVIYSLTMALLMIAVSSIAGKRKTLYIPEKINIIQKLGAVVLMLAGLFILWTIIFSPLFVKLFFP